MTGKSVTCTRSTRPAAIGAQFNDKLPCERNGTHTWGEDERGSEGDAGREIPFAAFGILMSIGLARRDRGRVPEGLGRWAAPTRWAELHCVPLPRPSPSGGV